MYDKIKIRPNKTSSIYRKHPWIFSGAISETPKSVKTTNIVSVVNNEEHLGIGVYFDSSIAIKMVYFGKEEKNIKDVIVENLQQAILLRKKIFKHDHTNAFRLVNAEGDLLPGLVIDKYNDVAVIQMQNSWILPYLEVITEELKKDFKVIYNKSSKYLGGKDQIVFGDEIQEVEIKEFDLKYIVNFVTGQKTGFFLDQRINRKIIGEYSKDLDVLNVFSYSGGFSVAAHAGGAKSVTSLDYSEEPLFLAQRNFQLNFGKDHTIIEADFFKYEPTGRKYDLIVLDPPAFTKHRSAVKEALYGYQTVNRKAIRLLNPSGLLATFSCSQLISEEDFAYAIQQAALAENKNCKILAKFDQAPCHVTSLHHPEGRYLKGLLLHIS